VADSGLCGMQWSKLEWSYAQVLLYTLPCGTEGPAAVRMLLHDCRQISSLTATVSLQVSQVSSSLGQLAEPLGGEGEFDFAGFASSDLMR
jgi:hypothetical protein